MMALMRPGALHARQSPAGSNGGDTSNGNGGSGKKTAVIVIVSIAAAIILGVIVYYVLRSLRYPKNAESQGRKRQSWHQRIKSKLSSRRDKHSQLPTSTVEVQSVPRQGETNVNRHESIRSIATLPVYSAVPHDGEGVIAREGDREGMDTVVEFPETAEEQEDRREEEMESLWRIRQQRRQEASEREERRRRRREARARGDTVTLNALRQESMLRSTYRQNNGSNAMIAEHNSRPRERRVSAVNYAELGVARHDGTRVRANSAESDNTPLLDSAAAAGMAPARPWMSRETNLTHHRTHSSTSILSGSSFDSADDRPGVDRDASDFEVISLQQTRSRAQSHSRRGSLSLRRPSTQMTSIDPADLGESQIPLPEPPHYDSVGFEEAPPYEDSATIRLVPATTTEEHYDPTDRLEAPVSSSSPPSLPLIDRLPSIRITESVSPIDPPQPARLGSVSRTHTPSVIHEHEETN